MKRFDVVAAVKAVSRERFKDMPKQKRVEDKRFKKPRFSVGPVKQQAQHEED